MSASALATVLDNQATNADQYGDADLIAAWRDVARSQQHHNP